MLLSSACSRLVMNWNNALADSGPFQRWAQLVALWSLGW